MGWGAFEQKFKQTAWKVWKVRVIDQVKG